MSWKYFSYINFLEFVILKEKTINCRRGHLAAPKFLFSTENFISLKINPLSVFHTTLCINQFRKIKFPCCNLQQPYNSQILCIWHIVSSTHYLYFGYFTLPDTFKNRYWKKKGQKWLISKSCVLTVRLTFMKIFISIVERNDYKGT